MAQIDFIGLANAEKAITIMYIISITLMNFALIFAVIKKGQFLYKPNSLIVISMAFGDVFFALYPMVVNAVLLFGNADNILSCNTLLTSQVYQYWMIHFVYGTGLIVLSVELVYRYKTNLTVEASRHNLIVSVVLSSLPWILGLIIVLPLSMTGRSCDLSYERMLACFIVCVVLPAAAAILACGLVKCSTKLLPVQYNTQTAAYPIGGSNFVMSAQNSTPQTTYQDQDSCPPFIFLQTAHAPVDHPQQESVQEEAQYEASDDIDPIVPRFKHKRSASPPQTHFNHSSSYNPEFPSQHHPYQTTDFNPALVPSNADQSPCFQGSALTGPTREKNVLLIVAVINFVCVFPLAIFIIVGIMWLDSIPGNAARLVNDCLFWWSVLRCLITPAIMRQLYKN